MYFRICRVCGDKQEVSSKKGAESTICRPCYVKEGIEKRKHTCMDCGRVKLYACARDVLNTKRCKPCQNKYQVEIGGYTIAKPKKVHSFECKECNQTIILKSKPTSDTCGNCNRRLNGLNRRKNIDKPKKVKKTEKMRYFRICIDCGDTKQTTLSGSGFKRCRPCSNKVVIANRKARSLSGSYKKKKTSKPKKGTISAEAIERAQKINKQHRELAEQVKKVKVRVMSPEDERRLIDEYIANNDIVRVECKDTYGETDRQRSYHD